MSKWKETNKYGIRESKAAYRHFTRRMDKRKPKSSRNSNHSLPRMWT